MKEFYVLYGLTTTKYLNPAFQMKNNWSEGMKFASLEEAEQFLESTKNKIKDETNEKYWAIRKLYQI